MSDRSPIDQASPFSTSPVTTPTKSKAMDLYENRSLEDLDPFNSNNNNNNNNHQHQQTHGTNGHHQDEQHSNGSHHHDHDEHENGI